MVDVLNNFLLQGATKFKVGQNPGAPTLTLRLYTNNFAPLCTSLLSDFTSCAAPGYADFALTSGNWSLSTVACVTTATYPEIDFNMTGPGSPAETIFGHVLFDSSSSEVWWAQLWTTPFVIPSGGGTVKVFLSISDQQV